MTLEFCPFLTKARTLNFNQNILSLEKTMSLNRFLPCAENQRTSSKSRSFFQRRHGFDRNMIPEFLELPSSPSRLPPQLSNLAFEHPFSIQFSNPPSPTFSMPPLSPPDFSPEMPAEPAITAKVKNLQLSESKKRSGESLFNPAKKSFTPRIDVFFLNQPTSSILDVSKITYL